MNFLKYIFLFLLITSYTSFAQEFDSFQPKATIGGYGEMHYNYEKKEDQASKSTLDFHRFVVFIGYNFSEKWAFKSEVELEHNLVDDGQGELELEQAYIDYHHSDYFGFQAGVLLVSAGLINEFHEPTLFLGVERPDYNNKIIPTTWYGNGIGVYGKFKGFDYRVVVMEGLDADGFSASSAIRGGRQKGFKSDASNPLFNVKLDYTEVLGLKLGASFSYNNAKGDSFSVPVSLAEFHAQYAANNIYAVFEIGNISYNDYSIERSFGYYFDLGYNVGSFFNWETELIPFIRYSDINTAASTIAGGDSEKAFHYTQFMAGVSVKPLPNIVFKADYSKLSPELNLGDTDLFNLGVGYNF